MAAYVRGRGWACSGCVGERRGEWKRAMRVGRGMRSSVHGVRRVSVGSGKVSGTCRIGGWVDEYRTVGAD